MTAPAVETDAPPVAEVVVETPVAAPVVPVVETPVVPAEPLTRREAKQGWHEDLRSKAVTPVDEAPVAETPSVAPERQPSDTVSAPAPVVETPVAPVAGVIRVPVPEGHALRDMLPEFHVGSPNEERALRAALNSYVRRNEVAALQQQVQQLQNEKIEREAREAATSKWMGRPEYETALARYNEIKDAFGEADAAQYWKGVNAEFDRIAHEEYQQRISQVDAERVQRAAQAWKQEAWGNAATLPESIRVLPGYSQWFESAVSSFNAELELGHLPNVKSADDMHREFMRFFSARLTSQPEVVGVYKSLGERDAQAKALAAAKAAEEQRRIDKIKQDAVEEFKRQSAATRTQAPPNPLANLNAVSRDRLPTSSEAAVPAADDLSPNQLRKALRSASRDDFRRRLGG